MENPVKEEKKGGGKLKIFIILLVVVVVAGGAVLLGGGDFFQGFMRFKSDVKTVETIKAPVETVKEVDTIERLKEEEITTDIKIESQVVKPEVEKSVEPHLTVSFSTSSPSGSRTVNLDDTIAIFDVCAKGGDVELLRMQFGLTSNESIAASAHDDYQDVYEKYTLRNSSGIIAYGNHSITSPSSITLFLDAPSISPITITQNTCETISLVVDSVYLMESTVNDEELTVSLDSVSVKNPASTTDPYNTVIDITFPIVGNTLSY